jgi:hypothetical protein
MTAVNRGLNRRFGRMFRQLVAVALSEQFPDAEARPVAARISDEFADDAPASDVLNIPGVVLHVRADASPSWSTSLDLAENAAAFDGSDFGVLVEYRRGRNVDEAYAVMSLDGWARLARLAVSKDAAA